MRLVSFPTYYCHKALVYRSRYMAKRILLVEDSNDARKMERIMLEQYGYEVDEAHDGIEAVEKATINKPDLILMDIAMPHMDGFQATQFLKSFSTTADIPVIVLTAYRNFDEKAVEAGCSEILYKPLDFTELKQAIERHLA